MKRGFKSLIVAMFTFSLIFGLRIPDASALSCAKSPTVTEEMESSALVFKGTLISEASDSTTFQVSTWWKGDSTKTTVTLQKSIWITFTKGAEYIVFANDHKGTLNPNLCGNTGPSTNVNIESFGSGTEVTMPLKEHNLAFEATLLGTIIITIMSAIGVIRRFL
ncbi:hypothetical protein [Paenibacillus sp. GCM10028914]|uniref:hypothetical protein n=1 Tax=Paenibacillus sp. GCM10028914 TaxID=3273416 RepID=UPI00361A1D0A